METVPAPNAVIAGRYVIERELGRGGMATVFLARDRQHDARVAIKVLHPELAPLFAGERFAREIRITAGLQHPNVVPILDSGSTDGLPFYTMPYVEGESLAARLHREHQLPVGEALRIATDVADALAYAHDRGFIHRDIKPQNILLSSGHAVLADFGIARAMDVSGGERITESGVALGTAMYMSPEQGSGRDVDGRSDIYALGCVLYEMLAGSPPFTGPTPQSVLARHAIDPVPPISTVRRTVGPALEGVLARSLAKVPADRYANAHELKTALAAAAAEQAAMPATGPVRPASRAFARSRGRAPFVALGAAVAAAGWLAWRAFAPTGATLDANRIAVFPLSVRADFRGSRSLGEDVATVIGHALDGTGAIKWVDGWRLVDGMAKPAAGGPGADSIRGLARAHRCAVYLTGDVVPVGTDSVLIGLRLQDTEADTTIRATRIIGPSADAWRLGVRAINSLMPVLIPGATDRDLTAGWVDRKPEVIASFLLGEAAFRRARSTEALAHFRDAIHDDSTFVIAAIRGAQAAIWEHRASEAASLIQIAVAQPMPPRYAHFTRGYAAYIAGDPDIAAREFREAIKIDPEMATAWLQLGETYTHLLPVAGATALATDSAFAEAMRLDSSATHILLHPIESTLRRGRVAEATPLITRFLAAEPDSSLADQVRVMNACVSRGPSSVDWKQAIATRPAAVLNAAQQLAVAGAQLPCAEAAYTAIRTFETPAMAAADATVDARRWAALVGLYGVLIAEGRAADAAAHVDSSIARGEGGESLMLIGGPLAPALEPFAEKAVASYEQKYGPRCERCTSNDRLWQLGVWASFKRDTASLDALASALATRVQAASTPGATLIANATAARARLAHDDSTAIAALTAVLATPTPSGALLTWRDPEGRAPERLALARALFARREFRRAIAVADVFDSPANQGYAAYIPASLALRAAAADSASEVPLLATYRSRLKALRRGTTDRE